MKHWKNLLACLLAGVLALGVLTACSGLGAAFIDYNGTAYVVAVFR